MYDAIKAADTIDADGDGVAASVGLSLVGGLVRGRRRPTRRRRIPSTSPRAIASSTSITTSFPDSLIGGHLRQRPRRQRPTSSTPIGRHSSTGSACSTTRASASPARPGFFPVVNATPCFKPLDFGACLPPKDPTFCVPQMGYEFWAPGLYNVLSRLRQALRDAAARRHRGRHRHQHRRAAHREHRARPRADRARARRRRRRARLLPLEPDGQLRVGRRVRPEVRALQRRSRHASRARRPPAPTPSPPSPAHASSCRPVRKKARRRRAHDRRIRRRRTCRQRRHLRADKIIVGLEHSLRLLAAAQSISGLKR